MPSRQLVVLLLIAIILILPMKGNSISAQEQQITISDSLTEPTESAVNEDDLLRQYKTNRFLSRIKAEISTSEDELLALNEEIDQTSTNLDETSEKIDTLKAQMEDLDAKIARSEIVISNIESQIAQKESDIEVLRYGLEQKKVEISFQKELITEYLEVLFKDQNEINILQGDPNDSLNTLKILLGDDSTGEKLRSIRYSEVLERQGREIAEELTVLIEEEAADQKILEIKNRNLQIFHTRLMEEKGDLEVMREAKQNLLDQTKGEEAAYRKLLEESKAAQEEVVAEVATLRKNLLYVQDRIERLGEQFNADDYADLLNAGTNKKLLEYLTSGSQDSFFAPIWPIVPARGVSAYFRDSSYQKTFGFAHNAIDIRAHQGTPIKAPADGVVYKAKDNGYGYSYIQIAHDGGYMTTYGHVFEFMVRNGEEVKQGDVIGLSGGMPGTLGAGTYTTGPHLHFEVIKDGLYVDPLDYLNLALVPFDTLPDRYVDKALGDRKKVRRSGSTTAKVKYVPAQESGTVMLFSQNESS